MNGDQSAAHHDRYRRDLLVAGVFLLLVGAFLGIGSSTADAFPWRQGACDGLVNLNYNFAGTGWTPTREGWFSDGADDWDSIRKPNGGYLVDSASGGNIEVWIKDTGPGGGGVTSCVLGNLKSITIDPDGLSSTQFRAVASHEVGHAHGLDHTGPYDSFDGDLPTMTAGCALDEIGKGFADTIGPEQDDYASLTATFETDYHANNGFERGSSLFWGKGGGASVAIKNGGVDGSAKYARLYGYGGYMYQTIRIADSPNSSRARINYRKYYSISSGTVWAGLYSRKLDYVNDTTTSCAGTGQYHNGWNFVSPTVLTGWTYEKGISRTPSSSWNYGTSSLWSDASGWDGTDLRLYVYNYMKHEGSSTYVRLDRLRAYKS
ncbi:hypothetical protein MNBD_ACTINO02-1182 [hydrothermal vent metagenome]|uniref:Peptidase M10 metallopeptidase domain-containing protein n=1 Tax=hydrothermal vent metagenome TaxID=652676 RepID=A0A3B0SQ61_9ZZZZ